MSVVNDVLKNLDQRHAQEKMQAMAPFPYDVPRPKSYWLLVLLLASLLICAVMAMNIWLQAQQNKISVNLPADLFLIDSSQEQALLVESKGEDKTSKALTQKAASAKKMVTRTAQTQAVDAMVNAIKAGDEKTVKSVLAKTPRVLRDEINLRLMLKDNPRQVYPYIKGRHKNFQQQANLLAMAAQAEQKSGNHVSAIELYKRLIVLQPRDARWRAGIAISLENNGKTVAAQRMYTLAMSLPNLPKALQDFSQQRLNSLR
ncbi:hypothetical protein A9Q73_08265 [Bermanella sp. 47_1433_sub80_T6]|nr:hypothetical protein A9Q73_08265 [Bermanella sp. 47_1433_sub80_T6]